jgi:hypothetical protein
MLWRIHPLRDEMMRSDDDTARVNEEPVPNGDIFPVGITERDAKHRGYLSSHGRGDLGERAAWAHDMRVTKTQHT